jgi:hypothetical protein
MIIQSNTLLIKDAAAITLVTHIHRFLGCSFIRSVSVSVARCHCVTDIITWLSMFRLASALPHHL